MALIIVLGVPGVGKSSVLDKVKALKPDVEVVNYGTVMFEMAQRLFGVKDRDEMRYLDSEKQKRIQLEAAKHIRRMADNNPSLIVDTHCSVFTPVGYLPGLFYDTLSLLKPRKLVLLTAYPEEIYRRRLSDPTRKRETDIEQIREHLRLNEWFIVAFGAISGAFVSIVYNHDGKLDEAVNKMLHIIEG